MKTLLLMRHAKSSWSDAGLADHDRPLNKRGRRDAPRMGRLLDAERLTPHLIISSTAERASETARLVAENCGYTGDIELSQELYEADTSTVMRVLHERDADRVLIVGHNPCMEELLERLSGQFERFPTAAVAHLQVNVKFWSQLRLRTKARLLNLWRPKELDAQ